MRAEAGAGADGRPGSAVVRPARSLARRYALLLALVTAPLLLLLLGMGLRELAAERRAQLGDLARLAHEQALTLEAAIKPVRDHVTALRRMTEDRLDGTRPPATSPWRPLLRSTLLRTAAGPIEAVSMDALAGTPLARRLGNLLGDPGLLARPAETAAEIDAVLDLLEPMHLAHAAMPYLRWSYYFSARGDLILLHPFAPVADMAAASHPASMRALIAGYLDYEVYQGGTPARDPGREPYWTRAYEDAGGTGWMVSHAAPVYERERFAGIVGTDLGLGQFAEVLGRTAWPAGDYWLVDDAGDVLAGRGIDAARRDRPPRVAEALPPALRDRPPAELLEPGSAFRHRGGVWVAATRLEAAPFTLVHTVPDADLDALVLPHMLPYALGVAALLALLLAALMLLQRRFVRPALALVRLIEAEAGGPGRVQIPRVPAAWRPWLDVVRRSFARLRASEARLGASEARFKAAAESLGDGLAIFDADDRLVFHNARYPENLGAGLRATMAPGKRWQDWWREAEALTPIFHPDMGPAYFGRRLAERALPLEDREHRLADGRWIRVREGAMPDGGRVAVTSDVTDRVHAREALEEGRRVREGLLEAALDCFVSIDAEGRITGFNAAAERVFGHGRAEVLGRPLATTLIPERLRGAHLDGLARHLATGERRLLGRRLATEVTVLHKDGREIPVEIVVAATHQDGGPGFIAYMRDLGDQKRAEAALRASEARFVAAAESIPDGMVIFDADDRIVFYNSRHPEHLPPVLREALRPGIRFEDFIRDGLARGPVYHPDMGPDYAERRLTSRRHDRLEHEHKHADGRWVQVRESRMPDGGRVLLTTDVTARRAQRRALNEQRRKLEAVLANIAEGVSIVDAAGRVVLVNDGFLRLYGFPAELGRPGTPLAAFVERRLASGRHPPDGPVDVDTGVLVRRRVAEILAQGPITLEEETPDGRTVLVRRERLPDGLLVSTYADISELKRRERENALLATAVEQAGDSVEIAGADYRLTYVNPAFTRLTGWTREEAVGHTAAELLRGDSHDAAFFVGLEQTLARGQTWQDRLVSRHKAGGAIFQEATISPLRDAGGRLTHFVAVRRDIGERLRAEEALRASEQRLRAIVENHPVPMSITRIAGRKLLFANRAFLAAFGIEAGDLETFDGGTLFADPADREAVFERFAHDGTVESFALEMRTADGRPFPAVMTARLIDYEGVPCSVVSILDLTALKAAEAEIARQREALYQGEKLTALGSLLAGVAHELNNPLSIVTGYAEILRDLAPDETTRERAQEIYEAAARCARIIRTFLAMARQRPPQLGPVDLPVLVESALELAAYGLRTAGVTVETAAAVGLPPVWGDGDQLHQVLLNLIINAQQAMLQVEGPRRLAIRVRATASAVVTEVEDNGPGMPPEVEKRIFDPFFTTKPQGVGTGIGLSICHSIVTAHGGRIEVETAPGRGALLRFALPAGAEPTRRPPAEGEDVLLPSRGRVLIVDDERGVAELVAVALRRDGLEAETAASGRTALARLERGGIDLIVSDVRMPDMDGAALVEAVRAARPELARRLILITGDVLGARTGEAVGGAGLPVLEKPLDLAALRREVRRLLEGGGDPGPPEPPEER